MVCANTVRLKEFRTGDECMWFLIQTVPPYLFGLGKFLHSREASLTTWRSRGYIRWTIRSCSTRQSYDSITQLTELYPDDIVKMTLALDPIFRDWVPFSRSSFQGAKLAMRLEKGKWKQCCWQREMYGSPSKRPQIIPDQAHSQRPWRPM